VAFDFLGFIAGRPKVAYYLQHGLGQPFGRHFAPVIELKGK
jgi:hypothetical protein